MHDTRTIRVSNLVADLVTKEQARVRRVTGEQISTAVAVEIMLGMRDWKGVPFRNLPEGLETLTEATQ